MIRTRTPRTTLAMLMPLVAALAWGSPTAAQQLPTSRRVLPYQGRLEIDGVAYTGDANIRFSIYHEDGWEIWTETWSDDPDEATCDGGCAVPVVDGHFEVLLGRYQGPILGTWPLLSSGAAPTLGMHVQTEEDGWVELLPRQRLTSSPVALWTYGYAEALEVNGSVIAQEWANVRGTLSSGGRVFSYGDTEVAGGASGALVEATTLDVTGAANELDVGGRLTVNGDLTVSGNDIYVGDSEVRALGVGNGLEIGSGERIVFNGTSNFEHTNTQGVGYTFQDTRINGELQSDHWRMNDDDHLYFTQHFTFEQGDISMGTGISKIDYMCWVGGVRMTGGDMCTGSVEDCTIDGVPPGFRAFTEPTGVNNTWQLIMDFPTHNTHETAQAMVVCVQTRTVDFLCSDDTDGTSYYPDDCAGDDFWFDVSDSRYPGSWRQ